LDFKGVENMESIVGIEGLDSNSEKRAQVYQNYYEHTAQKTMSGKSTSIEKSDTISADNTVNVTLTKSSDGDTYQKSITSSEKTYNKKGKVVSSTTFDSSYTKTKFVSERPSDVTDDMASNLFKSLDSNKDHLLESSEYSRTSSQSKTAAKE
jgi:hypothetical protein